MLKEDGWDNCYQWLEICDVCFAFYFSIFYFFNLISKWVFRRKSFIFSAKHKLQTQNLTSDSNQQQYINFGPKISITHFVFASVARIDTLFLVPCKYLAGHNRLHEAAREFGRPSFKKDAFLGGRIFARLSDLIWGRLAGPV